ncbi:acyl-CoA dehydrogenase [Gordonia sp. SID5947]|nr:acyl-CoA dehydrogenase family protein [Gordonia sp. SID5947]MYR06908.1 acyl-CoA dehydrogenase [Gordonia sp. SID5947]
MDFALSTDQQDLADAERAWLQKHDPILERRPSIDDGPATISATMRKHLTEAGYAGLLTDEVGATNVDLLLLVEAHGWAGSALPLAEVAIGSALLEAMGFPRWRDAAAGEEIVIPVRPSTPAGLDIELTDDGLRIHGTTAPATGLVDADRIVLIARAADGGDVAAVIPIDDVGVRVRETLDLLRSWAVVDIDLTVGAGQWASMPAGTADTVTEQLATFRAADALGCADRLLGLAVDYAGQRTQFDRPIGTFQAVKHHLANMALAVEASRSTLWAAALALDDDALDDGALDDDALDTDRTARALAVSSAVAFACRSAGEVAQLALQVHGGIGFTWEHDVHLLLRRIKVDELLDGSVSDHHRRITDLRAGSTGTS